MTEQHKIKVAIEIFDLNWSYEQMYKQLSSYWYSDKRLDSIWKYVVEIIDSSREAVIKKYKINKWVGKL